jgi:dihydropteroate synthase
MRIPLTERHWQVMGVVNITPDSFSDGGRYIQRDLALRHAEQLLAEGADILDLGAESTRPGATPISLDEELSRLIPVLEGVRQLTDKPLSIDTYKAGVMREALAYGADWINDISALADPDSLPLLADHPHAKVCVMHMQGSPETMQNQPHYQDVVQEVLDFLAQQVARWGQAGLSSDRLMLDPGFGFGKTLAQNITLFQAIPQLVDQGYPVLIGISRKRMIGELLDYPQAIDRVAGSVAGAVEAVRYGAQLVRVHDVKATVDALTIMNYLGNR